MAPLPVQPHSCEHCQKMVISLKAHDRRNRDDDDMASKGALFDFSFSDLKAGAQNGCNFCNWILDEECISRASIISRVPNDLPEEDSILPVILALQDSVMWIDTLLGEPSPTNTFRHTIQDLLLDDHRLFAATYQGSGNPEDIFEIEFFGLWNPANKKIVCRTRHGFQVFTNSQDPAAGQISTRPIENDPASDQSFQMISSWMEKCRDSHPSCHLGSHAMPARLIEIVDYGTEYRLRLRDTDDLSSATFAALSYCWGGDQSVKCLKDLIPRFSIEIPFGDLPATINDAISVCRRVGIENLWVDALCIIQDDPLDQAVEIAKMPNIYGNASFTIAAARSHSAFEGFLYARFPIPPTSFVLPCRCPDGQIGSITLLNNLDLNLSPDPIDERGWTLQERLLSSRTIEFGSQQTRWICQESDYEDRFSDGWRQRADYNTVRQDNLKIYDITNYEANSSAQPTTDKKTSKKLFDRWSEIVESYTRRKLSISTDRALAISGIAETFGRQLPDQYRAGLWTSAFHAGLLWQIDRGETCFSPAKYQGPSWSWVSVNGPVNYPNRNRGEWEPEDFSAEILDCDIDLISNDAPYGSIREGSGRLRLRARTAHGQTTKREGKYYSDEGRVSVEFFGSNDSGRLCNGTADVWLDTNEEVDGVTVLELRSGIWMDTWLCFGLVLQEIPGRDGVFQRVGSFNYETGGNSRKSSETQGEWEKRTDLEFNWFKNLPWATVEII